MLTPLVVSIAALNRQLVGDPLNIDYHFRLETITQPRVYRLVHAATTVPYVVGVSYNIEHIKNSVVFVMVRFICDKDSYARRQDK